MPLLFNQQILKCLPWLYIGERSVACFHQAFALQEERDDKWYINTHNSVGKP